MEIAVVDINNKRREVKNICNNIQKRIDKEKKNGLPQITSPSIHMTPASLRDVKPSNFTPRVVSIGPLHRSEIELQVSERHKVSYMNALFSRVDCLPEKTLEECVGIVHANIGKIRACYTPFLPMSYDDDNFVEMMIIDACFIIEIMCRPWLEDSGAENPNLQIDIWRDLVLLENQIPFFVLQDIFNCTFKKVKQVSLTYTVLMYLRFGDPFLLNHNGDAADENYPHILSLFHNNLKPVSQFSPIIDTKVKPRSAVELARHGVKLMAKDNIANSGPHIEFKPSSVWLWGAPTLEMTTMTVSEGDESVLRNLIAYEQSSQSVDYCITSFVMFLDMLVNTKEDLVKLVEAGIIANRIGSDQEAVNMIKSLSKQVVLLWDNFLYVPQWQHLTRHCDGYWPKKIAFLRRTAAQAQVNLKNPWRATAIFAAVLLFLLTGIQTYYAVNPVK